MNITLQQYFKAFTRLKRGGTKYGLAPHKPVLLLSVIELIEKGIVTDNQIIVDANLVGTFKENWLLLVNTPHQEDFTQPFFYLQNEKISGAGYWFLQAMPGCQINAHIKSVNVLANVCQYGYLATDLWILLNEPIKRNYLKQLLLDTYFSATKYQLINAKQEGQGYLNDQISDLLEEPEAKYKRISIQTEEDVFVRSGLFKRLVTRIYQNQCSFTGMKMISTFNYNFIDACHIVPFNLTHNDKVNNGIALCPNLHRVFDRGLVSVNPDYRILVSKHLTEDEKHPYGLKQLAGKKMLLPIQQTHYPAQEALTWHRMKVFKG